MKKFVVLACAVTLIFVVTGQERVHALSVVDPDIFADDTDISTAFAGVTLSVVDPDNNTVDDRVYSINSSAQSVEPFNASTGTQVFGNTWSTAPHLYGGWADLELRIDFSMPVDFVSLDIIGNDSSDSGYLEAYDAGGTLLEQVLSSTLILNGVETLSSSMNGIAYVLAGGLSGNSVGFDNLQYDNVVPEPSTILLLGAGLFGLVGLGRKKFKK